MAGREVQLTPMEFQVLRFLAEHPGRVYTRRQIREGVLSPDATVDVDINSRDMDKHISVLRRRLEPNPSMPQYILTVRGVGYKFREK
jgi:DNA-binding response OmpR family regulator